jgi:hypothetical protein
VEAIVLANDKRPSCVLIGCCPSNLNKPYFRAQFLTQLLPPNLLDKIVSVNLHEQPESFMSERIVSVEFANQYSKQLAVQTLLKFIADFQHILFRQDRRDPAQIYSLLRFDEQLPSIFRKTLTPTK